MIELGARKYKLYTIVFACGLLYVIPDSVGLVSREKYPVKAEIIIRKYVYIKNILCETGWDIGTKTTVPHSDTCGSATHSLNIGAGSR